MYQHISPGSRNGGYGVSTPINAYQEGRLQVTLQTVWVLGKWTDETNEQSWSIEGVFPTRERALEFAEPGWFIGPAPFDAKLPAGEIAWPSAEVV
jgi:hypothetical protein